MKSIRKIKQSDLKMPHNQAYRKSLQRLRWFRSTFEEQVKAIEKRTDIKFQMDPEILASCFIQWIRSFEANKPREINERPAYVGFAAGKMLQQLVINQPLRIKDLPKFADDSVPEYFWPEGFVYVAYCLNVRQAVLKNDFEVQVSEGPALDDIRTWWSFKENLRENSNYAMSFLDLFAGEDPDWSGSGFFNGSKRLKQLEKIVSGQLPQI